MRSKKEFTIKTGGTKERNFLNKTVSERKSYAVKRLRSEDIALDTKILQVQ